jgi:hypothetical protein
VQRAVSTDAARPNAEGRSRDRPARTPLRRLDALSPRRQPSTLSKTAMHRSINRLSCAAPSASSPVV